jgi:hypothetical protein
MVHSSRFTPTRIANDLQKLLRFIAKGIDITMPIVYNRDNKLTQFREFREFHMQSLQSKIINIGPKPLTIHIMDAGEGHTERFAMGKRYWIAAFDGSPRRATSCSNSRRYIQRKFDER